MRLRAAAPNEITGVGFSPRVGLREVAGVVGPASVTACLMAIRVNEVDGVAVDVNGASGSRLPTSRSSEVRKSPELSTQVYSQMSLDAPSTRRPMTAK
jgi:hypothetical protein